MAKRRSRVGTIGNVIVSAILIIGAWLVWSNVSKGDKTSDVAASSAGDGAVGVVVRGAGSALARSRASPRAGVQVRSVAIAPSGLAIPVDEVKPSDLIDTFTASRSGGARVHNAIDIMAPIGRPIVSAAPGTVEKMFNSVGKGGLTVYVRSLDGRWMYYYAHLSAYDARLKEGQRIARGTPIGLVGHTGSASANSPHLHMAVNRMNPGDSWWQGTPVNPYPMLAGNAPSR